MTAPLPHRPSRSALLRKIILLFLLVSATAFGIIFMFKAGYPMAFLNLISLDAALLGLTAGFGARFILKRRHTPLRLLAAFAALIVGLIVLGLFTKWEYGLGPLTLNQTHFDWAGLLQLGIGGISIVLSMFAWVQPVSVVTSIVTIEEQPPARPVVEIASPKAKPAARVITKALKKSRRSAKAKTGSRARTQRPVKTRRKKIHTGSTTSVPRRRSRKSEVQFTTGAENRCPYCLEPVQPDDPRGVVECKICHTLHHADCWAITGVCQVPHLN